VNPRTTAVLALVALALGAFIWFYEIEGEADRKAAEQEEKHLFPGLDSGAIEWISLETSDGVAVRLERRDARWRLTEPFDFPADAVAVDAMAGALADLAQEQAIEAGQPLSVYGLAEEDARRVEFGTAQEAHALRIGRKAPLGSNTYVARGSDDAVFTVPTWRTNALSEELLDLRDRRVLAFDAAAVRRLEASWPGGHVVAVRSGETGGGDDADEAADEAGPPDGGWRLVEPLDARADADRIDGLLSDLTYLRADGFVDEALDDTEAGLAPPDFAISLHLEDDAAPGSERTIHFALGRPRDDGQRLARGANPTLYALASERIDDFPRSVVEYRDRELARFVPSEAEAIELVFASEGEGASIRVELRRDDASWTSDPPLRAGAGAELLAALASLKASDVVEESSDDARRGALGLAPPLVRIRVLGRSPEEEGAIAPVLGEVLLGHSDPDGSVVAMRPDRPEVFRLAPDLADDLPVDHTTYESRFTAQDPGGGRS
jgi:hypothetical protein